MAHNFVFLTSIPGGSQMILRLINFWKRPVAATFLILAVGIVIYANTIEVPFYFDDEVEIVNKTAIRDPGFLNTYFTTAYTARFFALWTFSLNYRFDGLDVTGYHVVNLLVHLTASVLVYLLLRLTFRTPYFQVQVPGPRSRVQGPGSKVQDQETQSSAFSLQPSAFIPIFAALLFVAHPVQTQAVTYIVQRMTSMATMFYLLSVVLYVQARLRLEARGTRHEAIGTSHESRITSYGFLFLFAGSVISAILAMKTKEIAFTLPFAIVLYEVFFFRGAWPRRVLYLLPMLATLPIVPLSVFAFSLSQSPTEGAGDVLANLGDQARAHTDMSRFDYLFTQFRVIVTYLRLLILPVHQNLDYDYPIYATFFTPPVFLSFLLLVALLAFALYLWLSSSREPHVSRLISFGILWFFLALSVESSLVPIADVIVEHRLYLPGFGAATVFAAAFFCIGERFIGKNGEKWLIAAAALVILALGVAAFQRNQVWGSAIGMWQDVVAKSPGKARPYSNLSAEYIIVEQGAAAIPLAIKAIELNPGYVDPYINLAAALNQLKRFSDAATVVELNLELIGDRAEAHYQLGLAYVNLGNREAARRQVEIVRRSGNMGLVTSLMQEFK